jgi:hypothetical protein
MYIHNKKFDIKWIATALFIFGGTVVAMKAPIIKYAFPAFVLGHIIYLYDFIATHKNKALIFQNVYFFFMNIFACYVWWIK